MRARTGYRGLHELLSGTRVVRLPWPERREVYRPRQPEGRAGLQPLPPGLPERLGIYALRGTLRQKPAQALLLGEDMRLGRAVWVRLGPEALRPSPTH